MFMDYGNLRQTRWARIWTRKGFRHVMAVAYDPHYDNWLLVEPQPGQCLIRVVEGTDIEKYIAFCKKHGQALAWTERHRPTNGYSIRTCVAMMKDIIGFNARCITPYGMYRQMIKAGAKPAWNVAE